MHHWSFFLHVLAALFVTANPIGAVPLFITLTGTQSPSDRHRTALVTGATVATVLVAAALVGESLLTFFGVSLPSFRVGGGILIMMMAVAMLHARHGGTRHTPEESEEAQGKESVGVVPLGIPLLAGPGAISTIIVYAHQAQADLDVALALTAALMLGVAVWAALHLSDRLAAALGTTGINIVTRVMGLLLAAIAVELIAGGLRTLLPGLGAPSAAG